MRMSMKALWVWLCVAWIAEVASSAAAEPQVVRCIPVANDESSEPWLAKWIWGPVKPNGPTGFFRKTVEIRPGLRYAWAQLSGDDGYTFYVNGQVAKQGGFWWKRTDRIDVASLLRPGKNLLAAELRNHADPGGWLLELTLSYDDGRVERIATDNSWRFTPHKAEGWSQVEFDDRAWTACAEIGSPPKCPPWGFLPHESLGNPGQVQLVSAHLPDQIEAGAAMSGHLEVRVDAPVTADARLMLELNAGRSEVLRRAWRLDPPATQWRVGESVRIELPNDPFSRFLPKGPMEWTCRLTDVLLADKKPGELIRKKVQAVNAKQGTLTEAVVKPHRGMPALFIAGKPTFPMWFWQREILAEDAAAFQQAGVDVFTFCSPSYYLLPGWVGEDAHDYAEFDAIMMRFLEKAPNAYAIPRIFVSAPDWWLDKHPEEACRFANGVGWVQNGWGGTKHESFASQRWRHDSGENLRLFVRHIMQSPYSDRVIGLHVANGIYGEWHTWSTTDIPDTSEPMRLALRDLVKQKYHDEASLRRAWGEPAVTFDNLAVPTIPERQKGDVGMFRDPAKSSKNADYYECLHRVTVDAIDHFCGIVKRESQGRLLTCVFYSYTPDLNWPQEGDHRAAAQAHRLASVDIFSSPHSYCRRKLGDDGLFRNYPAALASHGKLFVDEADDRTSLAKDPSFTHVNSIDQSIEVVRREFGNAVTHAAGLWYMDQQDSWFHDPRIMQEIGKLKRWGDISLNMPRESVAEVAVISSLETEFRLCGRESGKNRVTYGLYDRQIGELSRSGATFDWFLMEDLVEGRVPPHKAYLFLDAFCLTPAERQAVEKLQGDKRTLIAFYAPGYVSPTGLSLQGIEQFTGMKFEQAERGKLRILLEPSVDSDSVGQFGPEMEQSPRFSPKEGSGLVWGRYADSKTPGLMVADHGAWRSVFCGSPELPADVLRKLFAEAGVHIYCESGDNVTANAGWLSLHTKTPGTKVIRLPKAAKVLDVIHNKVLGESIQEFRVDLPAGATAIFAFDVPQLPSP